MTISPDPIYDSAKRPIPILDEVQQLFKYRDLIVQLVRRDIVTRYKRSVLGVAWTMLNPLGMMLVLAIAFSQVFGTTRAYSVYLITGIVAWNFFAQTSATAMRQFQWGGGLIQRIYIPKTAFAVSAVGTGLVNLFLSMLPVVIVMLVVGVPLQISALFIPFSILLLAAFSLGVGLLLSRIAAYFWDVTEIYEIALLAWMYLTPIIYPEEIIPEERQPWLFHFNPLYHLIKLFRVPLYESRLPSYENILAASFCAALTLFIGWWAFTAKSDEYAYRI